MTTIKLNTGRIFLFTTFALIAFAANSVLNRLALGGNTIDAGSYIAIRLVSGAVTLALINGINKSDFSLIKTAYVNYSAGSFLPAFYFYSAKREPDRAGGLTSKLKCRALAAARVNVPFQFVRLTATLLLRSVF